MNLALKMAIVTSGKTQIALCRQADLSEARLSRIVNGHNEATEAEKKAIARALRKPIHELFPEVAA